MAQVVDHAPEQALLFQQQVGALQLGARAALVLGLDQHLQQVQRQALQTVTQQEALAARELLEHRHQPGDEQQGALQRRPGAHGGVMGCRRAVGGAAPPGGCRPKPPPGLAPGLFAVTA